MVTPGVRPKPPFWFRPNTETENQDRSIKQQKNNNSQKVGKNEKNLELEKKNFGFDTNTKIGPWFQFPIPKPGLGSTLVWILDSFKILGPPTQITFRRPCLVTSND